MGGRRNDVFISTEPASHCTGFLWSPRIRTLPGKGCQEDHPSALRLSGLTQAPQTGSTQSSACVCRKEPSVPQGGGGGGWAQTGTDVNVCVK